MRRAVAAGIVLASATSFAASAQAAISLKPHRAVYDLTFAGSPDGQTVSAGGEMTFEVRDACTAWATQQMLQVSSTDRDGTETATRSDDATYETKDGSALTFTMTQKDNGTLTDDLRGHATIAPGRSGHVRFLSPAGASLTLPPGTLFPMAHTRTILEAAAAGRHALSPLLFDGTGTDGAEYSYVTIVDWGPTVGPPPNPALAGLPSGRIDIAFYPLASTDMMPEYEIGTRYFANGVGDRLLMDFGGFRLAGQLKSLTMLPQAKNCRR